MEILLLLLVITAIYKAARLPHLRKWLLALGVAFVLGCIALGNSYYWMGRSNCGKLYNPDIGCANVSGGCDVILGLSAGLATVIVSLIILVLARKPASN